MDYQSAIGYLYGLQKHGMKFGLENTVKILSLMGDPQESFKSIHIAGTNGKGSTAAFTAGLLERAAFRTGLFTSPHLVSFTERIRVNGREITEEDVVGLTSEIVERLRDENIAPTFFEFATAIGFLYFRRNRARWAVIETGMGGRLDATNVVRPEVSVITGLSEDHGEFLGNTLREMAREKAGIIKAGMPVVSAAQSHSAMDVIKRHAEERGAPLYVSGRDFSFEVKKEEPFSVRFDYSSEALSFKDLVVPLGGAYQAENASLAIKAFELCAASEGPSEAVIREGLCVRWPGRFERIAEDIVIDGAHNPAAAAALAGAVVNLKTATGQFKGAVPPVTMIIGVMKDKDVDGILRPLLPLAGEVIFTAPAYERAATPEELSMRASALGFSSGTAASVADAIAMARKSKPAVILITGSFFTIGEAKEALGCGARKSLLQAVGEWQRKS